MGTGRADDPAGQRWRPPARGKYPEVLNAVFYLLSTGCHLQALPKDLPPRAGRIPSSSDGKLERLHHTLYVATC